MKKVLYAFLVAIMGLLAGLVVHAQSSVSTEQQLRVDLQSAREQLFSLQVTEARCRAAFADATARLDSVALNSQAIELKAAHDALEQEIRTALGAKEDDVIDWSTTPPSVKK